MTRRKAESAKRARGKKGIRTSRRTHPLVRNFRSAWKEFKRNAWNALAGVGLITVLILVLRMLGGG